MFFDKVKSIVDLAKLIIDHFLLFLIVESWLLLLQITIAEHFVARCWLGRLRYNKGQSCSSKI